jgi:hypothetical protein
MPAGVTYKAASVEIGFAPNDRFLSELRHALRSG